MGSSQATSQGIGLGLGDLALIAPAAYVAAPGTPIAELHGLPQRATVRNPVWQRCEMHLVNSRRGTGWHNGTEHAIGGHHVDLDSRVTTAINHLTGVDGADG